MGSHLPLTDSAVRERLLGHLRSLGLVAPETTAIDCRQLAGGFSHETWRVTAPAFDAVVKVATGDGPLADYDIEAEARATESAAAAGVPTAKVLASTNDANVIGAPFMVSEYIVGAVPSVGTITTWLDGEAPDFRCSCARSVVKVLVGLGRARPSHAAPPRLDHHYGRYLDETVAALEESCRGVLDVPSSVTIGHRWLESRLVEIADDAPGLAHGDFRIGNLIFQGSRVAALIDWERAGWGHPLYDVGYLCLPGMRHGTRVAGLMTEHELCDLWADVAGEHLDLGRVAFFRCMSIFTELSNCVRALVNYSQGRGRTSLLRILPLVVRLENDMLTAMERIDDGDLAL